VSDASLSRAYFEELYERDGDPWRFATSAYEREKYARSLAMLPDRISAALEIGCSIGVFTRALAPRCDDLLAIDISERALVAARERCADLAQVRFRRYAFPSDAPTGRFDAIVLAEVAYYWSDADLALARDRIAASLAPHGTLLLVHYLPKVEEYVRDGDAVHAAFLDDARFRRVAGHRAERYRIDVLRA
jgi:SAM-dependent methyltransferase